MFPLRSVVKFKHIYVHFLLATSLPTTVLAQVDAILQHGPNARRGLIPHDDLGHALEVNVKVLYAIVCPQQMPPATKGHRHKMAVCLLQSPANWGQELAEDLYALLVSGGRCEELVD